VRAKIRMGDTDISIVMLLGIGNLYIVGD